MAEIPLQECHCVHLRRAANNLTSFYSKMLEPCGLSLPQFSLLKNIHALGDCNTTELSRRMGLDYSTLARNLKHLQKEGLARNEKTPGRKLCAWRLTEKGRKALAEGGALWQKAQEQVAAALGEADLQLLRGLLNRLRALEPRQ